MLLAQRCTTPRIWLSALPCGRPGGSLTSSSVVWKNSLPPASRWPVLASGMPSRGSSWRLGVGQRVELAADLARVARDLAHALLVAVELLERDHRQVDVVLLEAEQRHRVVHQHVGVEHEQLGRPVLRGCAAAAAGAGSGARRAAAGGGRTGGAPAARRARRSRAAGAPARAACGFSVRLPLGRGLGS
jgi:hypothetical protein